MKLLTCVYSRSCRAQILASQVVCDSRCPSRCTAEGMPGGGGGGMPGAAGGGTGGGPTVEEVD